MDYPGGCARRSNDARAATHAAVVTATTTSIESRPRRKPACSQGREAVSHSRVMRHFPLLALAAASLFVIGSGPSADAQTRAQKMALEKKLLGAKMLKCTFSTLATGDWEGDKTKSIVSTTKLEIAFSSIDIDEGTAEADGGYGNAFRIAVKSRRATCISCRSATQGRST